MTRNNLLNLYFRFFIIFWCLVFWSVLLGGFIIRCHVLIVKILSAWARTLLVAIYELADVWKYCLFTLSINILVSCLLARRLLLCMLFSLILLFFITFVAVIRLSRRLAMFLEKLVTILLLLLLICVTRSCFLLHICKLVLLNVVDVFDVGVLSLHIPVLVK